MLIKLYDSIIGLIMEDSMQHVAEGATCRNAMWHSPKKQEIKIVVVSMPLILLPLLLQSPQFQHHINYPCAIYKYYCKIMHA